MTRDTIWLIQLWAGGKPLTFLLLIIMRQNDANYYENQNLCVNHFLNYISRLLPADQQDSNHILSSLFSFVGPLPFLYSPKLKPSTLRRIMVFGFGGCSKSNSSNGLSSTSLIWTAGPLVPLYKQVIHSSLCLFCCLNMVWSSFGFLDWLIGETYF